MAWLNHLCGDRFAVWTSGPTICLRHDRLQRGRGERLSDFSRNNDSPALVLSRSLGTGWSDEAKLEQPRKIRAAIRAKIIEWCEKACPEVFAATSAT